MRIDDKIYIMSIILMIIFVGIVVGVEFCGLSMFTLSFIFFGIPAIVFSAVFWYELLHMFIDSQE